jgi:hypothetical protein
MTSKCPFRLKEIYKEIDLNNLENAKEIAYQDILKLYKERTREKIAIAKKWLHTEYRDIRLEPDDEKYKAYEEIGVKEKEAIIKQHESGFPSITIDYEDIHLLTDIISLENWWKEKSAKK